MSISINFPFARATGSVGYFESTDSIADALRANVCSLLTTNWGERLMHADFGCNLRQFLFEPKTLSLKHSIYERVQSQLSKWMRFIVLTEMFVHFSEDDPSIPDPGMKIELKMLYGNIPVNLVVIIPGR